MAAAATRVPDDFLDYLRGLNLEDRDKTKPGVCYDASTEAARATGNETLTESLRLQKEEHQQEINRKKTEHMKRLADELAQRYEFYPEITQFISVVKQFIKQLEQLDRNKSDIESSSSTWKIERFAKYTNSLKINFVQPYYKTLTEASPPHFSAWNVPDDLFSSIQQRYLELASVYLGTQVTQVQGLFARVGSGDPVRVLRLFHNNYTGYCCIHLLYRTTYNLSLPRLSANYYGLPTTVQLRAAHESRCSLVGVSRSTALQVLYCTCLEQYHYGTVQSSLCREIFGGIKC